MEPSRKIGNNACNDELKKAADAGSGSAALRLARFYKKTTGEEDKALMWAERGADLGNASAMYLLAKLTFDENITKTVGWLKEGANRGHEKCMLKLGDYSRRGVCDSRGEKPLVYPDLRLAIQWYQTASSQGSLKARVRLGDMDVKIDRYKEAMTWYKLASAAETGSKVDQGRALSRIGDLYRKGLGVKRNTDLARSYYQRAIKQGYGKAEQGLDAIDHKVKYFVKVAWDFFYEPDESSESSE